MDKQETISYNCHICGYTNVWTRDEVLRVGTQVAMRGDAPDVYLLPCKNPDRPRCKGRHKVGLNREDKP